MFFKKPSVQERRLKLAGRCECAFELCERSTSIFHNPLQILAYNRFRPHVQASVFDVGFCFLILLKPTLTPFSIQIAILHEISHICFGHLVPVTIQDFENWSGETYFTPYQEEEAQKFACKLLNVVMNMPELSPPNPTE